MSTQEDETPTPAEILRSLETTQAELFLRLPILADKLPKEEKPILKALASAGLAELHGKDDNAAWRPTDLGREMTPAIDALLKKEELKQVVRFMYDLQQLRIQAGLRGGSKTATLSEKHQESIHVQSFLLQTLEKTALTNVKESLANFPIWKWLEKQKGCGPTMAGVLISEIDIQRAETASQIWAYCGLAVKNGEAQRRRKGEKAGYNPWLKAKVVEVLAGCMLKSNSPWREFYDNYKTRKKNTIIPVCMGCEGKKKRKDPKTGKLGACSNCSGKGKDAPWGRSDAHRDRAAKRYMVKMFLVEFHKQWRELEGLSVPPPYAEAYLDAGHGTHSGTRPSQGAPEARV